MKKSALSKSGWSVVGLQLVFVVTMRLAISVGDVNGECSKTLHYRLHLEDVIAVSQNLQDKSTWWQGGNGQRLELR